MRAENVVESAVSFAGADGIVRDKPLHFFLERYAEALPRRRTCRISSSGWPSSIGPVLKLKLRKAAEEGAIYFPAEAELVTAEKTRVVEIDHLRFDHTRGGVVATQPAEPADADLLIVSEGDSDRVVIATLAERILASAGSGRSIKILSAMGKVTIPRVANALWDTFHSESKVLIVVDGDNEPAGTAAMLANGLEFGDWVAAIPNPSIETWLGLDLEALR